ncbi:MAG TPA: DMT family transporter [Terriglobales bacterium]|nr:DMT family transporter [Terriglobales bacterium]
MAVHSTTQLKTQPPEQIHRRSHSVWPVVSLAAAGCLWGTGFLSGKIAFAEMNVFENCGYRFIFGSLGLLPILWKRPPRFRDRRAWMLLLAASVIGVPVQFLMQFKGLQLTTVSHASLIVGILPVLLALGSAALFKDKLKDFEYGLMLLSALGAVLIAFSRKSAGGPQPTITGDLLVFVSMFAALVMILISKRLMADYGSLQVTAAMLIIGTLILLAWTEFTHPVRTHFSTRVWLAVIAQGVLATTGAYVFWNWGLARVPAARAGVFLNLEPLIGTILGVVILHERLGAFGILGGALILISAAYFSRRPQPRSVSSV